MYRAYYRPFSDHNSLLMCRTVDPVNSNGTGAVRWYEFRNVGTGSWSIYQEGTYDPDDGLWRWMPSIAMNASGDIALAYSISGTTRDPGIAAVARRDSDPLGVMTTNEKILYAGNTAQSGVSRWGDYSMLSVDPTDNYSFWFTSEYSNGGWNWATRITQFQFPVLNPPSNVAANSITFYEDRGGQVTVTGTDLTACSFEIGGVTGSVASNNGSTAVVNFPAANYTNSTLTVSNANGSDTDNSNITVSTRNTIPVVSGASSTSNNHPTIQSAIDGLLAWYGTTAFSAGDLPGTKTINVEAGTYTDEVTLSIDLNPVSGNTLVIQNNSGDVVTVNATGNDYGFNLNDVDYVTLSGFTVHSANLDNIISQGNNVIIKYNKTYSSVGGSGIKVEVGTPFSITNNLSYSNFKYGIEVLSTGNTIKNNTAYDNGGTSNPLSGVEIFNDPFNDKSNWVFGNWDLWSGLSGTPSGDAFAGVEGTGGYEDITSNIIDVNGYDNLTISCYYRSYNGTLNNQDDIIGRYSFNGSIWTNIFTKSNDQNTWAQASVSGINPTSTNLYIQFRADVDGSEYWFVDDVVVTGDETSAPSNTGAGLYLANVAATVENNIFVAKTGSDDYYALISSGNSVTSDYNTYYSTNTNLFDYNGTVGNTGPMGTNDLTVDPKFVNSGTDFHLQSTNDSYAGGTWPPSTAQDGIWSTDASDSPALDAGNPADGFANEPAGGMAINQGCYGNTPQASKSAVTVITWTGATDSDWSKVANWNGGVPSASDDICIPSGLTNYPAVDEGDAACKNLTIDNGGTFSVTTGTLTLVGNWINNGTFNSGTGKIVFAGSADQTLGGSGSVSFNDVDINNANVLHLSSGISVAGTLAFVSGSLDVADQTVILGDDGVISGESNMNMIFGTIGTIVANNRTVGTNIAGMGIDISSGSITNIDIIRGVTAQSEGAASSLKKYYDISATPGTALNATMKMYYFDYEFNANNGGTDESEFVFYRSTDGGSTWSEQSDAAVNTTNQTITLSGIDAFSRWTISSKTSQPLPVVWQDYKAVCNSNGIMIEWTTSAEINNDYFTVEKMVADEFEAIATINGAGNSSVAKTYSYTDVNKENENYYRIKQTDFDNNSAYSPIFYARCNDANSLMEEPFFNVYPNPFSNNVVVQIVRCNTNQISIDILNNTGVIVGHNSINFENRINSRITLNTSRLPLGIYLLKISAGDVVQTRKIIKTD